jgi:hypothetical protein
MLACKKEVITLMTWNYRVLEENKNNKITFRIIEVYYDENGLIWSWIENEHILSGWDTLDDLKCTAKMIARDVFTMSVLKRNEEGKIYDPAKHIIPLVGLFWLTPNLLDFALCHADKEVLDSDISKNKDIIPNTSHRGSWSSIRGKVQISGKLKFNDLARGRIEYCASDKCFVVKAGNYLNDNLKDKIITRYRLYNRKVRFDQNPFWDSHLTQEKYTDLHTRVNNDIRLTFDSWEEAEEYFDSIPIRGT